MPTCEHCGSVIEDPKIEETPEPEDQTITEPGKYKVDVEVNGQSVRFFGPEGNLRARVFRGGITRQVRDGLKSMESPVLRQVFIGDVRVGVPRTYECLANTGRDRRFVVFSGMGSGGLVLELLDRNTISKALENELRRAFQWRDDDEQRQPQVESAEPEGEEELLDHAGEAGTEGQGNDPEHGESEVGAGDGEVEGPAIDEEYAKAMKDEPPMDSPLYQQTPLAAITEEKPFTTIRKGGVKPTPPKQKYYRRPQGLGR